MSRISEENFKSGKCFMPNSGAPSAASTKTKGFYFIFPMKCRGKNQQGCWYFLL